MIEFMRYGSISSGDYTCDHGFSDRNLEVLFTDAKCDYPKKAEDETSIFMWMFRAGHIGVNSGKI